MTMFLFGQGESAVSKDEINAFLGANTIYQGKLSFQGAVRIDGKFTGEILSEGTLIAGKEAVIDGNLDLGELVLSGTFVGKVKASRRVTIHNTGSFQGDLHTPALVVEEGAKFDGQICMREKPQEDKNTDNPKKEKHPEK